MIRATPYTLLHNFTLPADQIGGVFNGGEGGARRATGHPRRYILPAKNFRKRQCCGGHQRAQAIEQRTPSRGAMRRSTDPVSTVAKIAAKKKRGAGSGTTRNPGMTPQQTNSADPRQQRHRATY